MSDGTTATASGMDTHKRWFLLDYEPTSVRVCVCVRMCVVWAGCLCVGGGGRGSVWRCGMLRW